MFNGNTVLKNKRQIYGNVWEYQLELDQTLEFVPGQFVSIEVDKMIRRSYSILSVEENLLTLVIDLSPGGPGSKFFAQIKPGQNVKIMGPLGRFTLSNVNIEKVFIATGTGIVPFVPMIKYLLKNQFPHKISLFFGTKFLEENKNYHYLNFEEANYENFEVYRCITRDKFIEDDHTFLGRVTEVLPRLITNWENKEFYICGVNVMIDDVVDILNKNNVSPSRIFFEKYG
ncbi:MAG: ferredoxin--NADP(+) reductase [Candidatus Dojkabacteria bacterium]|nr:MAG: ferredoxin--NADP(+) reductase [Candidatus Dojkabacteria bacterium]